MTAERTVNGLIRGLHAQDPIHVSKKLDCKVGELYSSSLHCQFDI